MKRTMLLLLAAGAGAAFAQTEGSHDPRKPHAQVPPVIYRSAFEDYRPFREQELAPWRRVNEEVARVGGHAGVVKDGEKAQEGQKKDEPAGTPREETHR